MQDAAERVRLNIEKSAFSTHGGYYLDYNSSVGKKVFANWTLDNPLPQNHQNAKYLEAYDRHLRSRILSTPNTEILPQRPVDKK